VAGDRRSGRPDAGGSAVELRDTETPDFLLIARFKRKHGVLLRSRNYRLLMLAVYENPNP
jgi:hypothetical protein